MQEGFEGRDEGVGEDVRALGCGMDAVLLDGVGNVDQVYVDHGDKGGVMLCRHVAEDLIKGLDIVFAVIRRESDAGKQYLYMSRFQRGEHLVEIVPRLVGRKAAKPIVAPKLDDHELGVQEQNRAEVANGVFRRCAACTLVADLVMVAKGVKFLLQIIGIGLARLQAVSGGYAVAEADQKRAVCSLRGSGKGRTGQNQETD